MTRGGAPAFEHRRTQSTLCSIYLLQLGIFKAGLFPFPEACQKSPRLHSPNYILPLSLSKSHRLIHWRPGAACCIGVSDRDCTSLAFSLFLAVDLSKQSLGQSRNVLAVLEGKSVDLIDLFAEGFREIFVEIWMLLRQKK